MFPKPFFLHENILGHISHHAVGCLHDERASVNATTDHTEIQHARVQQGVLGVKGSSKSSVMDNEEKTLECPAVFFFFFLNSVCDVKNTVGPTNETVSFDGSGSASGNRVVQDG